MSLENDIFFSEKLSICLVVGQRCKLKVPFLPLPRSATEARNAYTVLWLVKITVQVNLFYAVTPKIRLSYMSLVYIILGTGSVYLAPLHPRQFC